MQKVDVEKLKKISKLYTQKELCEMFDVHSGTMSKILKQHNLEYKKVFIDTEDGFKPCPKCNRILPLEAFSRRCKDIVPTKRSDVQGSCKECRAKEKALKRKLDLSDIAIDRIEDVKKHKSLYCEKCRKYYPKKEFTIQLTPVKNVGCTCGKCGHTTIVKY